MTEPSPDPGPETPPALPGLPAIGAPSLVAILALTWAAVWAAFAIPEIPGDGGLAELAYWVSFSGKEGLVVMAAIGSALVVTSSRLSAKASALRWGLAGMVAAAFVVGGGALFNEHAIKRTAAVPRPFVQRLADEGTLGMTPEAFYALGGKEERREHLRKVLTAEAAPYLSERLRSHWVVETGFSFPSGHSYAATSCAALFLVWGLLVGVEGWRRVLLGLFLPWSLGVCYSRPMLGVHSPLDVTVGCALGFTFGAAAALALWRISRADSVGPDSA